MRAIALAMRQRQLRLLLAAGLVSLTGDWILRVGLAYYVYALTGDTLASALMLLASFIPQIVLGSLAGVFVDRWDLRRTMVAANMLLALGLLPLLAVHRPGQIWIVYAVTAWEGCVQQFFTPAQQSLLPRLVDAEQLVTANALNSQNSDLSRLIGSALGGAAAAAGGINLLALLDAASFLLAAALIAAIPTAPRTERTPTAHPELRARLRQLRTDWADGMRLSLHQHVLRVIVVFLLVTSVGEGIMSTLFAPFVRSVLHASAETYGLIVAAQAIGGIGGGLLAASIGNRLPATRAMGWAAIAFGLIDLALFLYPLQLAAAWPAIVLMILAGFPGALMVTSVMTLLQRHTTDSHRGRVFGALGAAEGIAIVAGTCTAGFLGQSLGIVPVLAAQGAGYVLAGMLVVVLPRHDSAGHTAPERRTHKPAVGH
ncbi:MFS transporter [Streptomyces sp. NPDC005355]|uniref:MFS transporter n=1 Tax=Streptomyces sp. NPDC005355 TaxID=3157038 RepID=UPI0033B72CAC